LGPISAAVLSQLIKAMLSHVISAKLWLFTRLPLAFEAFSPMHALVIKHAHFLQDKNS
jgi:hypothetical protein